MFNRTPFNKTRFNRTASKQAVAVFKIQEDTNVTVPSYLNRNSIAYLYNCAQVATNAPRFDTQGSQKGLTIESSSTNNCLNPRFESGYTSWTTDGTYGGNKGTAFSIVPLGANTMFNTTTNTAFSQSYTTTANYGTGTPVNITETGNVIQLGPAGTNYSKSYSVASDWTAGTEVNSQASGNSVIEKITYGPDALTSLTGWTTSGTIAVDSSTVPGGGTAFKLGSTIWASGYRSLSMGPNTTIEFDVYCDTSGSGLMDFFWCCNSSGSGQQIRVDCRGTYHDGWCPTTAWGSGGQGTLVDSGVSSSINTWHHIKIAVGATTALWYVDGTQRGSAYTFANNGTYGGFTNDGGGAHNVWVKNLSIRPNAASTWQSPSLSLAGVAIVHDSTISWTNTLTGGCSMTVQTSIDGGGSWQTATSGSAIPNLTAGYNCSSTNLLVLVTFGIGTNGMALPLLNSLLISVNTGTATSGSWTSPAMSLATVGTGAFSNIAWTASGTGTLTITTSLDGGSTWQTATSGTPITNALGLNCTGKNLIVKASLTGNGLTSPVFSNLYVNINPNGECLQMTATNTGGRIYQTFTGLISMFTYTVSCYVNITSWTSGQPKIALGSNSVNINTALTNQWVRYQVSSGYGGGSLELDISVGGSGGNATGTMQVTGVQFETLAAASSYIDTVTRSPDSFSFPIDDMLNWTNGTVEGLIYWSTYVAAIPGSGSVTLYSIESTTGTLSLSFSPTQGQWTLTGPSGSINTNFTSYIVNGWNRVAIRWTPTEASIWINGVKCVGYGALTMPTTTSGTFRIGCSGGTQYFVNTQMADVVVSITARNDASMTARGVTTPLGADKYTSVYLPLTTNIQPVNGYGFTKTLSKLLKTTQAQTPKITKKPNKVFKVSESASSPGYVKTHTINNSSTVVTNYPYLLTVILGTGTDSGNTMYIPTAHAANWPYDIRFYDGATQLPYWREDQISPAATTQYYWINIDSIPNGSMTLTVKYGTGLADGANMANTFTFADHFTGTSMNGTNWTAQGGTPVVSNSIINIGGYAGGIVSNTSFSTGYFIRGYVHHHSLAGKSDTYFGILDDAWSGANGCCFDTYPATVDTWNNYLAGSNTYGNEAQEYDQWQVKTIKRKSAAYGSTFIVDGVTLATNITTKYYTAANLLAVLRNNTIGNTVLADWIVVGKVADIEPTDGAWGGETALPAYINRLAKLYRTFTNTEQTDVTNVMNYSRPTTAYDYVTGAQAASGIPRFDNYNLFGSYYVTSNWNGNVGTYTWNTNQTYTKYGTQSRHCVYASGNGCGMYNVGYQPLIPGQTYTASAWVYINSGSVFIEFEGVTTWGAGAVSTPGWNLIQVTFTFDHSRAICIYSTSSTCDYYIDSVQLVPGNKPLPYFNTGNTNAIYIEQGTTNYFSTLVANCGQDGSVVCTAEGSAAITNTTSQAYPAAGAHSQQVVTSASVTYSTADLDYTNSPAGNTLVTSSLWLRGNAGGEALTLYLYDDGGWINSISVTLTNNWQQYSITGTTHNQTLSIIRTKIGTGATAAQYTFFIGAAQLETGSVGTTWMPGQQTRSADALSIPKNGVLNDNGPWTVEINGLLSPNGALKANSANRSIFFELGNYYTANQVSVTAWFNWGALQVYVFDNQVGTASITLGYSVSDLTCPMFLSLRYDGSTLQYDAYLASGHQSGNASLTLANPIGNTIQIGSYTWSGGELNGLLWNFRVSNIYRTNTEILNDYTNGYTYDNNTTYFAPLNSVQGIGALVTYGSISGGPSIFSRGSAAYLNTGVQVLSNVPRFDIATQTTFTRASVATLLNGTQTVAANVPRFNTISDHLALTFTMNSNYYLYVDMTSIPNYTIQSGDYIEYDIMWSAAQQYIAFDYTCSDGSHDLRDSGAVDQNGQSAHPGTDISAYCTGIWYHRKIAIPSNQAGLTISYFDISHDGAGGIWKQFSGSIKNICITNNSRIVRTIWMQGDVTPSIYNHIGGYDGSTLSDSPVYITSLLNEEWTSNLCTNGRFATDLSGWVNTGASAPSSVRDTTMYYVGNASAKVTFHGATYGDFMMDFTSQKTSLSGQAFTISAWVYTNVPGVHIGVDAPYWAPSSGYNPSANHPGDSQWHYLTATITPTFDIGGTTSYIFMGLQSTANITPDGSIAWMSGFQLEIKPYPTTFIDYGTTRASDSLTVPMASVLSPKEGTIEFVLRPHVMMNYNNYFSNTLNIGRFLLFFTSSGQVYFDYGTANWGIGAPTGSITANNTYRVALRWSQTLGTLALFINGVKYEKTLSAAGNNLTGNFPATMNFINNYSSEISDYICTGRARSDAELLARNTTSPLGSDASTSYYLPLTQTTQYVITKGLTIEAAVTNVVSNPFLNGTYSSGLAPSWGLYNTPTVSENNNSSYYIYGGKSQHVVTTSLSGIMQVFSTLQNNTYTVSVWVYIVSGMVSMMFQTNTHGADIQVDSSGSGWQLLRGTTTTDAGTSQAIYVAGTNAEFYVDAVQIEQNSYGTSFTDIARSADIVTIPTAGVINWAAGTIEGNFLITKANKTHEDMIFSIETADGHLTLYYNGTGLNIEANQGSTYTYAGGNDTSVLGWNRFAMRWSATETSFWINGVKCITPLANPSLPTSTVGVIRIGHFVGSAYWINSQVNDIVISNISRNDVELAFRGNVSPLQADNCTVAYLPLVNNLQIIIGNPFRRVLSLFRKNTITQAQTPVISKISQFKRLITKTQSTLTPALKRVLTLHRTLNTTQAVNQGTNYYSNTAGYAANHLNGVGGTGTSGTFTDVSSTIGLTAPVPSAKTWQLTYTQIANNDQWLGWEQQFNLPALAVGTRIKASGYYQIPANFPITNHALTLYKSDWSGTVSNSVSYNAIKDGQWHYFENTVTVNTAYTNPILTDAFAGTQYINWTGSTYWNGLNVQIMPFNRQLSLYRVSKATQAQTLKLVKMPNKILKLAQAQTARIARKLTLNRTPKTTQATTPKMVKVPNKIIKTTQAQTLKIAKLPNKVLKITQAQTAKMVKLPNKVLKAAESQTAKFSRMPNKVLKVAQAQTARISRKLTLYRTSKTTQAQTARIARVALFKRILAKTQATVTTFARKLTLYRAFARVAESTTAIFKKMPLKLYKYAEGQTLKLVKVPSKFFKLAQAQTARIARVALFKRVITLAQATTPRITRVAIFKRLLTRTQATTATLVRKLTLYRTNKALQGTTGSLKKVAGKFFKYTEGQSLKMVKVPNKVLKVAQAQTARIARKLTLYRSSLKTQATTPTASRIAKFFRTITKAQATTATLVRKLTLYKLYKVTQAQTPKLTRIPNKVFKLAEGQTLKLVKIISKYFKLSEGQTPRMTRIAIFKRAILRTQATAATLVRKITLYRSSLRTQATTATIGRVAKYFRTVINTQATTPVMTRVAKYFRAFARVAQATTPTMKKVAGKFFKVAENTTATIKRLPGKFFKLSEGQTPRIIRITLFKRVILRTQATTATLARKLILYRTIIKTQATTPAISRVAKYFRAFVKTQATTPVMNRIAKYYRAFTRYAENTTATMKKVVGKFFKLTENTTLTLKRLPGKFFKLAEGQTPRITRVAIFKRVLLRTQASVATLARKLALYRTLIVSQAIAKTLARKLTLGRVILRTQAQVTTISRIAIFKRTLVKAQAQTATLARKLTLYRVYKATQAQTLKIIKVPNKVLNVVQAQTIRIARIAIFKRTLAKAQGTALVLARKLTLFRVVIRTQAITLTFSRIALFKRVILRTQATTATLARKLTLGRLYKAAQGTVGSIKKGPNKVFKYAETQTAKMTKIPNKVLKLAQSAISTIKRTTLFRRTLLRTQATTATLARKLTLYRVYLRTQAQTPTFSRIAIFKRTLLKTQATVSTLTRKLTLYRLYKATQAQTSKLTRIPNKVWKAAQAQTARIARVALFKRTILRTQATATTFARKLTIGRLFTKTQAQTLTASRIAIFKRAILRTQATATAFSRKLNLYRLYKATQATVVTLGKITSKIIKIAQVTVPTIKRAALFKRTLARTQATTTAFSRKLSLFRPFARTQATFTNFAKKLSLFRTYLKTEGATATLSRVAKYFKAFTKTQATTPRISRTAKFFRAFTKLAEATATFFTDLPIAAIYYRTFAYAENTVASLKKFPKKFFARTQASTGTVNRKLALGRVFTRAQASVSYSIRQYRKIIVKTQATTATLARKLALYRSSLRTQGTTPAFNRVLHLYRAFARIAESTTATIKRIPNKVFKVAENTTLTLKKITSKFFKLAEGQTARFTRLPLFKRTMARTQATATTFNKRLSLFRTYLKAEGTTVTLSRFAKYFRTYAKTQATTVTLSRFAKYFRLYLRTQATAPVMKKVVGKFFKYAEGQTLKLVKLPNKVFKAVQNTAVAIQRVTIFKRTLAKAQATATVFSRRLSLFRTTLRTQGTTATLVRVAKYFRLYLRTQATTPRMTRLAKFFRTFTKYAEATVGFFVILPIAAIYYRTFTLAQGTVATMKKLPKKTFARTQATVANISRKLTLFRIFTRTQATTARTVRTFYKILLRTQASAGNFARKLTLFRIIPKVEGTTPILSRTLRLLRAFARTQATVASLKKIPNKVLKAVESTVASLKKVPNKVFKYAESQTLRTVRLFNRTFAKAQVTATTLARKLTLNRVFSRSQATTPIITRVAKYFRTVIKTQGTTATLSRVAKYYRAFIRYVENTTATMKKLPNKVFKYVETQTLRLNKIVGKFFKYTESQTARIARVALFKRTILRVQATAIAFSRRLSLFRKFVKTQATTGVINRLAKYYRIFTKTQVTIPTISRIAKYYRNIIKAEGTVASLKKVPNKVFKYAESQTLKLAKMPNKILKLAQVTTVRMTRIALFKRTIALSESTATIFNRRLNLFKVFARAQATTATLGRVAKYFRVFVRTQATTPIMKRVAKYFRAFTKYVEATVGFFNSLPIAAIYFRTFAYAEGTVASVKKLPNKVFKKAQSTTLNVARKLTLSRLLARSQATAPAMSRKSIFYRIFTRVVQVTTPTFKRTLNIFRAFARASQATSPTIKRALILGRKYLLAESTTTTIKRMPNKVFKYAESQVAKFVKLPNKVFKSVEVTVATLKRVALFKRTLAKAQSTVVSLARKLTLQRSYQLAESTLTSIARRLALFRKFIKTQATTPIFNRIAKYYRAFVRVTESTIGFFSNIDIAAIWYRTFTLAQGTTVRMTKVPNKVFKRAQATALSLARKLTLSRLYKVAEVTTPAYGRVARYFRSFVKAQATITSFVRKITLYRLYKATQATAASMKKLPNKVFKYAEAQTLKLVKLPNKVFKLAESSVARLYRIAIFKRTLAKTQATATTFARKLSLNRVFARTQASVVTLVRGLTLARKFIKTQATTLAFSRIARYYRTFAKLVEATVSFFGDIPIAAIWYRTFTIAQGTNVYFKKMPNKVFKRIQATATTFSRKLGLNRVFARTQASTPVMVRVAKYFRNFAKIQASTISMVRKLSLNRIFAKTQASVASMARIARYYRSILRTQATVASMKKLPNKVFKLAENTALKLIKLPNKVFKRTQATLAGFSRIAIFKRTLAKTQSTVTSFGRRLSLYRLFAGTQATVTAIFRRITLARKFIKTQATTPVFNRVAKYFRAFTKYAETTIGFFSKIDIAAIWYYTFTLAQATTARMTKVPNKVFKNAESMATAFSRRLSLFRKLIGATNTSPIAKRVAIFKRTITKAQTTISTMSRKLTLNRTFTGLETIALAMSRVAKYLRAFTKAENTVATMKKLPNKVFSLAENTIVRLTRIAIFKIAFTRTQATATSMRKLPNKVFKLAENTTLKLLKLPNKVLKSAETAVATFSRIAIFKRTLAKAQSTIASMTRIARFYRLVKTAQGTINAFARKLALGRLFTRTQATTAAMSRISIFRRTIVKTITTVTRMSRIAMYKRTLALAQATTTNISRRISLARKFLVAVATNGIFNIIQIGGHLFFAAFTLAEDTIVSMKKLPNKVFIKPQTTVANASRRLSLFRILKVTQSGVMTLRKLPNKVLKSVENTTVRVSRILALYRLFGIAQNTTLKIVKLPNKVFKDIETTVARMTRRLGLIRSFNIQEATAVRFNRILELYRKLTATVSYQLTVARKLSLYRILKATQATLVSLNRRISLSRTLKMVENTTSRASRRLSLARVFLAQEATSLYSTAKLSLYRVFAIVEITKPRIARIASLMREFNYKEVVKASVNTTKKVINSLRQRTLRGQGR